MSLEPATEGHGAARGARFAAENDNLDRAVGHLARGVGWTSDMIVMLEQRVVALEAWAQARGYEVPDIPDRNDGYEEDEDEEGT
jgi:hypothetical protein